MKEQIREKAEQIVEHFVMMGFEYRHCNVMAVETMLEKFLQEQKQEIIEGERLRIKSRVGSLRQWLNELPNDFIVSNDVIEHWLEISEQLKQEKQ